MTFKCFPVSTISSATLNTTTINLTRNLNSSPQINPFREVTGQDSSENIKNSEEKERNLLFQAKFSPKIYYMNRISIYFFTQGKKKKKKGKKLKEEDDTKEMCTIFPNYYFLKQSRNH